MPADRKKQILELLDDNGSVSLTELGKIFSHVSMMTLRRDLIQLEEDGIVIRTHGGAVKTNKPKAYPGEESAYQARESQQHEAKKIIAKKALAFVETGRSIYLDSGSTLMNLAHLIPDNFYSIITSGVNIALTILEKEQPSVIVLGGFANRNTFSTSGPLSTILLDSLNIDVAFISAAGFSIENNFTVSNAYEANLKTKVLQKAKKSIVLMDTSKLNKTLPYTFGQLKDIDVLITEGTVPEDIRAFIEGAGVQVI